MIWQICLIANFICLTKFVKLFTKRQNFKLTPLADDKIKLAKMRNVPMYRNKENAPPKFLHS